MEPSLILGLPVVHHYMVVSKECDVDVRNEAYFRAEVLAEILDERALLCIHRMEVGEVESNKALLNSDVPGVAGGVDARYYKAMANANTRWAAGLEDRVAAVPVNHSGRVRAEAVHGYCRMDSAT